MIFKQLFLLPLWLLPLLHQASWLTA